jgi:hypothetical protein
MYFHYSLSLSFHLESKMVLWCHSVCVDDLSLCHCKVGINHLLNKLFESGLGNPSDLVLGLGRVSEEQFDLGRTEISWVNLDQNTCLVSGINTNLIDGSEWSNPLDGGSDNIECSLNEFSDTVARKKGNKRLVDRNDKVKIRRQENKNQENLRVGLSGSQDVIVSLIGLQHHVHTLDVVASMTPIALGVNVPKVQGLLDSAVDASNTGGNLTGDESAATAWRLVVEQDTVGEVHAVGFSVVDKDPEGILLGDCIFSTKIGELVIVPVWNENKPTTLSENLPA